VVVIWMMVMRAVVVCAVGRVGLLWGWSLEESLFSECRWVLKVPSVVVGVVWRLVWTLLVRIVLVLMS